MPYEWQNGQPCHNMIGMPTTNECEHEGNKLEYVEVRLEVLS